MQGLEEIAYSQFNSKVVCSTAAGTRGSVLFLLREGLAQFELLKLHLFCACLISGLGLRTFGTKLLAKWGPIYVIIICT